MAAEDRIPTNSSFSKLNFYKKPPFRLEFFSMEQKNIIRSTVEAALVVLEARMKQPLQKADMEIDVWKKTNALLAKLKTEDIEINEKLAKLKARKPLGDRKDLVSALQSASEQLEITKKEFATVTKKLSKPIMCSAKDIASLDKRNSKLIEDVSKWASFVSDLRDKIDAVSNIEQQICALQTDGDKIKDHISIVEDFFVKELGGQPGDELPAKLAADLKLLSRWENFISYLKAELVMMRQETFAVQPVAPIKLIDNKEKLLFWNGIVNSAIAKFGIFAAQTSQAAQNVGQMACDENKTETVCQQ